MSKPSQSRTAFGELQAVLAEISERYVGPDWMLESAEDEAGGYRMVAHALETALMLMFEGDATDPAFRPIVSPTRKHLGDNPDAIYHDAAVSAAHTYRVTGRTGGAVYIAFTVEAGEPTGAMPERIAGVLNDTEIDIDADGAFALTLGGAPQDRNWLALPDDAIRITTRHYFEEPEAVAAWPVRDLALAIEVVDRPAPPPSPSDASVAAGLRRVTTYMRTHTLEMPPPMSQDVPAFVSTEPNVFPAPVPPGEHALAAADAAYSMAPFVLGPDEALVMSGRWPACRFGNVVLWNRHLQTFDYVNRRVSLNRTQTELDGDGRFHIVIAPSDPGVANWLDSEGRPFGMVFWRFFLPEGDIETPRAEITKVADLADLADP